MDQLFLPGVVCYNTNILKILILMDVLNEFIFFSIEEYEERQIYKVAAFQNSSSFSFFYFYIWLDGVRRAESEYI